MKFDPDAPCEKCGSCDLEITWSEAAPERPNPLPLFGAPDMLPAKPETLECECRRCGYTWQREPISVTASITEPGGLVNGSEVASTIDLADKPLWRLRQSVSR